MIVDAIAINRITLKIKLAAAFYDVVQATTVTQALDIARSISLDLVITSLGENGADVMTLCDGLTASQSTRPPPVLALAEADDLPVRMAVLAHGVRDVLVRPVSDALMLSRVRNLIRSTPPPEAWHAPTAPCHGRGMAEAAHEFAPPGHFRLVCDDKGRGHVTATHMRLALRDKVTSTTTRDALKNEDRACLPDIFVLLLTGDPAADTAQLHLISSIRSNASTRHSSILLCHPPPDSDLAAHALDLGADDLMLNGFDVGELSLRLAALLDRKRNADQMRRCVDNRLRDASYDQLTGLYNRRYAISEVTRLCADAEPGTRPFAVMLADIDHFKCVNDTYGHAIGDAVLAAAARRFATHIRPNDMAARFGGEEFLILLPGISAGAAGQMARTICAAFRKPTLTIPGSTTAITTTISIGICMSNGQPDKDPMPQEAATQLIDRADKALYAAKRRGRDCVGLMGSAA